MASIPLHCSVCPKSPKFSDVSHLLTHIASKGHLSHYYKVKVRSGSEEAARKLIQSYDRWYAEWNVEDLMSERMHLKEKRRSRVRASGSSTGSTHSKLIKRESSARPGGLATALDPRLSGHPIKRESQPTPPMPTVGPSALRRAHVPPMQLWPPARPRPHKSRRVNGRLNHQASLSSPSKPYYPDGYGPSMKSEDQGEDEVVSECTRLKGVCWPGMAIFDSATPEMRRKRNQKKDISVVEQLEQNSLEVEPSELVFTPSGSYKKTRKISGLVEDDTSPIKMDSSPRKPYGGRQPLAPLSTNAFRGGQFLFGRPVPDYSSALFEDEQQEFQLTYGPLGGRRKRGFEIFQDQEISFAHPAGFTLLNSEFHYNHHAEPSTYEPQYLGASYIGGTFDEKENFDVGTHYHANPCGNDMMLQDGAATAAHHVHDPFDNVALLNTFKVDDEDLDDARTVTAPASES